MNCMIFSLNMEQLDKLESKDIILINSFCYILKKNILEA